VHVCPISPPLACLHQGFARSHDFRCDVCGMGGIFDDQAMRSQHDLVLRRPDVRPDECLHRPELGQRYVRP
jgi:hypothetical protein